MRPDPKPQRAGQAWRQTFALGLFSTFLPKGRCHVFYSFTAGASRRPVAFVRLGRVSHGYGFGRLAADGVATPLPLPAHRGTAIPRSDGGRAMSATVIRVRVAGGAPIALKGRDAWALLQLVTAGERGLTAIERPAPRWSAYVHKLRKAGVPVETINEAHGGPFAGNHARYRLVVRVEFVGAAELEAAA
jgi:hypothetical protein